MTRPEATPSDRASAKARRWPPAALALWHFAGWLLVLTLPAWLRLGEPFWRLEPELLPQVFVLAMAYLALVLLAGRGGIVRVGLAGVASFAVAWGVLLTRPDLPYSRLVLLGSGALAVALTAVPVLWRGRPWGWAGGLAAVSAIVLAVGLNGGLREPSAAGDDSITEEIVRANHHVVRKIMHGGALPAVPKARGGGFALLGDTLLLATGSGEFYVVEEEVGGLTYRPLSIPPPMERAAYLDFKGVDADHQFRLLDLMVDSTVSPRRLVASHHRWHPDRACLTVDVSATTLPRRSQGDTTFGGWETVYESRPCFAIPHEISNRTGGRLARHPDGRLMLSLGTYRRDGIEGPGFPDVPDPDYGRILVLGEDGSSRTYSEGHRNPQGLLVTSSGAIWDTEHGPQGGDELNRITAGSHYGWPWRTHGTGYGLPTWPGRDEEREPVDFAAPTFTWVPSIGISQLIEVHGDAFPRWEGDLLIGSLRAESLYRVHLEGGRAVYAEPIPMGARIRDLVLGPGGRVFLWTDDFEIIVLDEARLDDAGERLFVELCSSCHEGVSAEGGVGSTGPDLEGVYQRFVATGAFDYTDALRSKADRRWNEEALTNFLRSPEAFAPGTSMVLDRPLEAEEIEAVVEYLKTYER